MHITCNTINDMHEKPLNLHMKKKWMVLRPLNSFKICTEFISGRVELLNKNLINNVHTLIKKQTEMILHNIWFVCMCHEGKYPLEYTFQEKNSRI